MLSEDRRTIAAEKAFELLLNEVDSTTQRHPPLQSRRPPFQSPCTPIHNLNDGRGIANFANYEPEVHENTNLIYDSFVTPSVTACDFCYGTPRNVDENNHHLCIADEFIGRYFVLYCHTCNREKEMEAPPGTTWQQEMNVNDAFPHIITSRGYARD
jgi:hypothetical protein